MERHYRTLEEVKADVKTNRMFFTLPILEKVISLIENSKYYDKENNRIIDARKLDYDIDGYDTFKDALMIHNCMVFNGDFSIKNKEHASIRKRLSNLMQSFDDSFGINRLFLATNMADAERFIDEYYSIVIDIFRKEKYIERDFGLLKVLDSKAIDILTSKGDKLLDNEHLYYINTLDKESWGNYLGKIPVFIGSILERTCPNYLLAQFNLILLRDSEAEILRKEVKEYYDSLDSIIAKYPEKESLWKILL